ncbi:hypothetical protein AAVH_17689 [Aphelenchoides avenae]|nr:hypothetical protein AAVH_17689 [Aphelenchus avenae]
MPLTAIRKFLNVVTFFLSITGIITNGVVIASLRLDTDYLRRECGQHVKNILYFAVFSGLSSLPYMVIIFINGANRCLLVSLMWTSALRVFTMRFEATQFLGLAVDRACSTMMPVTYNRYLRKHTCKMSLVAAFALSCCDAFLHLLKVEWFYEWHNICSILKLTPFTNS